MRCLRCGKESEQMDLCSHCGVSLKNQVTDIIKDLGKKKTKKKQLIKSLATTKDLRAVQPMVDVAMGDDEVECRVEAIKALALLGDRDILPYLAELLLKDKAPEIRLQSARAIGKLKGHKAINALARGLEDVSPEVKIASVKALRQLGTAEAVNMIARMLKGQEPRVERTAFGTLQKMGYQVIYDGEEVVEVKPMNEGRGNSFILPAIFLLVIIIGGIFVYKKFLNPEKIYIKKLKNIAVAAEAYSEELFALNEKLDRSGLDPTIIDAINTKSGAMEAKFRGLRTKIKDLTPFEEYTSIQEELSGILDRYVSLSRVMISSGIYSDFQGTINNHYKIIEEGQGGLINIIKKLNDIEQGL